MKTVSNLLKRLQHRAVCRRGKKGASLALVMIVGALLVIWVMCIMPLMSTTGTVAYDTQASLLSYLDNRSAIEYCKSELIYMAQTEVPSTFAVMNDGTGKYFAKHKKSSGIVINDATGYQLYVSSPTDNDLNDVPQTSAEGNQVAAICAVQYNTLTFKYDIIISTYTDPLTSLKRDYNVNLSLEKRNFLNEQNVLEYNESLINMKNLSKNEKINLHFFNTTNKSERKISFEVIDAILKDMRKTFVDRVNKEFE